MARTTRPTNVQRVCKYVFRRRTGATRAEIARATKLPYRSVARAVRALRVESLVYDGGVRNRARLVYAQRYSPIISGGF